MKSLLYQLMPFLFPSMRRLENLSSSSSSSWPPTRPPFERLVQPQRPPPEQLTVYEVCLSPACVADGACDSLERMRALAPPHVVIQEGSCSSQCGNGPVVLQNPPSLTTETTTTTTSDTNSGTSKHAVRHRKVSGDKILDVLYPKDPVNATGRDDDNDDEDDEPINPLNDVQTMMRQAQKKQKRAKPRNILAKPSYTTPPVQLVQGYDLVLDADAAFEQQDYETAVTLYGRSVEIAFATAMDWQRERERLHPRSPAASSSLNPPVHLEWLIRARRRDAKCKLELDLVQDAMLEAQAACNLSKNTCAKSFAILSEVYRAKGDLLGEQQALRRVLELLYRQLQQQQKNVATVQKEQRKFQLRLDKIERALKQSSPQAVDVQVALQAQEGLPNGNDDADDEEDGLS